MAKYSKYNSNYIKAERHQFLKGGSTIFERDWVTIGGQLHFGPGKVPYYNNGNFLFTKTYIPFYQKKFKNGVSVASWTYDDVENASSIVNKIDYEEYTEDIRSFAYYGSCVELVRTSVENIIKTFPGRLYKKNYNISYYDINQANYVESGYFEIVNDFGIDMVNDFANKGENEMKFLNISYPNYVINGMNEDDKFYDIKYYNVIKRELYKKTFFCTSNRKEIIERSLKLQGKNASLAFEIKYNHNGSTTTENTGNLYYECSVGDDVIKSLNYENEDDFWVVRFACYKEVYDSFRKNIKKYAKSVTFSEED